MMHWVVGFFSFKSAVVVVALLYAKGMVGAAQFEFAFAFAIAYALAQVAVWRVFFGSRQVGVL